jgi:hypothetical protein
MNKRTLGLGIGIILALASTAYGQTGGPILLATGDHPEYVPNWGYQWTVKAVATGNWTSTTTWRNRSNQAVVPTANDVVLIPSGFTVTVDAWGTTAANAPNAKIVSIEGKLAFSRTADSRLYAPTVLVNTTGTLDMGVAGRVPLYGATVLPAANPIPVARKAQLILGGAMLPQWLGAPGNDTTYDTNAASPYDPRRYSGGLVVLGRLFAAGADKTSFTALATAPAQGATGLTLSATPTGWLATDRLAIPDTRSAYQKRFGSTVPADIVIARSRSEIRPLSANVTTTSATVSTALTFAHPGNDNFRPHAGNLTRNVSIVSKGYETTTGAITGEANGTGAETRRAHVIILHEALTDIDNVLFRELGRTMTGIPTNHNGNNPKGRYSLHFHHMAGAFFGSAGNSGRDQFNKFRSFLTKSAFDNGYYLSDATIGNNLFPTSQTSLKAHAYPDKWQVAIHGSTRLQIKGNVFYGVKGAAVATEDGNEGWNEIVGNFALNVPGPAYVGGTNPTQIQLNWDSRRLTLGNTASADQLFWDPLNSDVPQIRVNGSMQKINMDPNDNNALDNKTNDGRRDSFLRGSEGVGFWLAGNADQVWDNIAADCGLAGIVSFAFPSTGLTFADKPADAESTWTPAAELGRNHLGYGSLATDLSFTRDTAEIPAKVPYGRNEVYGSLEGVEIWNESPFTLWKSKVWNCHIAIEPWETQHLIVDGLIAKGDIAGWNPNDFNWEKSMGVNNRFFPIAPQLNNLDIADFGIAILTQTPQGPLMERQVAPDGVSIINKDWFTIPQFHLQINALWSRCVQGLRIEGDLHYKGSAVNDIPGGGFYFSLEPQGAPARTYIRNANIQPPVSAMPVGASQVGIELIKSTRLDTLRTHSADEVWVESLSVNGVSRGTNQMYFPEQNATFTFPTLPASTPDARQNFANTNLGYTVLSGPQTNQQAWSETFNAGIFQSGRSWFGAYVVPGGTMLTSPVFSGAQMLGFIETRASVPTLFDVNPIWQGQVNTNNLTTGIEGYAQDARRPWKKPSVVLFVDGTWITSIPAIYRDSSDGKRRNFRYDWSSLPAIYHGANRHVTMVIENSNFDPAGVIFDAFINIP